ncbi:response regulator transcription factor [Haloflavibacter putidus]|uniref:Response regulator transcription factor n=1 Tax=Haloflavibacter putidus TaxID=2576776 RepID=A0A507ZVW3_9FLAO|nr:response regulator transcription factor [Haloflavibacter putidus]TQD40613.1 response regulator transcription factor [Haloflavibacter putidus]
MKILIIEDEKDLQNTLAEHFRKEKFVIEVADTYEQAHEKIGVYDYDCILLDIMLPGGSGLELLKYLKSLGKSDNVIVISAKNSLEDKLEGLSLGADDYLTKPFHIAELNARVKAVLRRNTFDGKNTINLNNTSLNIDDRILLVNEKEIHLNRKEFDILSYFMANQKRLVTKSTLAEHVWGDHIDQADNFDFIYYQIKNLRKKLSKAKAQISIEAHYGVGYKLLPE